MFVENPRTEVIAERKIPRKRERERIRHARNATKVEPSERASERAEIYDYGRIA